MLSVFSSYGEYIDRTTALEKGREFMKEKAYCAENTRSGEDLFQYAYAAEKSNIPCFYVFNRTGGGYVIVSADDQISEPILGYSTTGYFCYENLPEDAKYWIDSYADRIAASKSIPNKSKEQDNNAIGKEIPPLLGDLKWNQWSPYNLLCPEIDGILPPTGCVATAMAQIMRYHKWPEHGNGSVSYNWNGTTLHTNLAQSTYNWYILKNEYLYDDNDESVVTLATLMRDVGYSVNMNYSPTGSGASDGMVEQALKNNFNYSALFLPYWMIDNQQYWNELIKTELEAGRPVYYSGQADDQSGHAFVCDGSDSNGFFHFNFGWGGELNGYYLSSELIYSYNPNIVIGISPKYQNPNILFGKARNGVKIQNDWIRIEIDVFSTLPDLSCECAYALENLHTGDITYHKIGSSSSFFIAEYSPGAVDLQDGIYRIYPVIKAIQDEKWQKVIFSDSDQPYIDIPVENGTFVLPEKNIWVINGCTYRQKSDDLVELIEATPDENGKISIPDFITIDGQCYWISYLISQSVINNVDELKTLEIGRKLILLFDCPKLSTVIFTSDAGAYSEFYNCENLENVILPHNLAEYNVIIQNNNKIKGIDFPSTNESLKIYANSLNGGVNYILHTFIPPTITGSSPNGKEDIIFHIPNGYKDIYESAGFKGYNLIDDVELTQSSKIDWGYSVGRNTSNLGFGHTSGGDLALYMDSEALAPYIGKKITSVNYYVNENYPTSIFVSGVDRDFVRTNLTPINEHDFLWYTYHFDQPYIITGESIYVGLGFNDCISGTFSTTDYEVGEQTFYREKNNEQWVPVGTVCVMRPWPVAMSVVIEGEELPVDIVLHNITSKGKNIESKKNDNIEYYKAPALVDGNVCTIQMLVQNRSSEKINQITASININDDELQVDIPCLLSPNMVTVLDFDIPASDLALENSISVDIIKGNDKPDCMANKKNIDIINLSKYTKYPKTNVVEGFFWDNERESELIISTIEDIRKKYGDSTIGILIGYNDEPINYTIPKQNQAYTHMNLLLFTSRKEDYATDSIPDFERILSIESNSYGMVEKTIAILDDDRCEVSSEIKIGGTANGNDFTVAYAVIENQVGPLSYKTMDFTQKEAILDGYARGIFPDTYGEFCLPEKIEKDVSYSVFQSFELPNSIQDRNNIEIVALLINRNGEIVNAEKVTPIERSNSILIETIEIVEDNIEMNIGESRQLKARILPENATDKRILWTSDNELIASVDNNGLVTLKNQGTVNIFAKSMDGSNIEDVCTIYGSAGINEILTEGMQIDIYDMNGACLKHNVDASFFNKLEKGCYIIKSRDKVYKIIR